MARKFTVAQAKTLLRRISELFNLSYSALSAWEDSRSSIRSAVKALQQERVLELLSEVPVEELNRGRRGLRIKLLRDNGYETAADVLRAGPSRLADINGIGRKGAVALLTAAEELSSAALSQVRFSLSADKLSPAAFNLLKAIGRERVMRSFGPQLKRINEERGPEVLRAMDDLRAVTGLFSRFFSAPETRQQAEKAFDFLSRALEISRNNGDFALLRKYTGAQYLSDDELREDFIRNYISYIAILQEICPSVLEKDRGEYGLKGELAKKVLAQPLDLDGLNCVLRHFQLIGVKYILAQKQVLLGDEMGLGKTVQAIAAMVALRNEGMTHFLVICPVAVLTNWCREIESKSDLRVTRIHGSGREAALEQWLSTGGVAVTGYETTAHIQLPEGFRPGLTVVDEAHYIKNAGTKRSLNTRRLCAASGRLLFMTGTALENKVAEMVTLIRILNPEIASAVDGLSFMAAAPRFRELISPVYFRRRREEVLEELPELIESPEWCTLLPAERLVYEDAVLRSRFSEARRVSWNAPDLSRSAKAMRLLTLAANAAEDGRKIIVFSYFLDTIDRVCTLLGPVCMPPITGSTPNARRQEIIDAFNAAPAGTVLPAQIVSGGTGLNIQSASVVILCEPQLKPSIENQAIARAYRMGQARNVLVYRLLCENSIDERLMELLSGKQEIFDEFADISAAGSETLSIDENTLTEIMEQEKQRISAQRQLSAAPVPDEELPSPEDINELIRQLHHAGDAPSAPV